MIFINWISFCLFLARMPYLRQHSWNIVDCLFEPVRWSVYFDIFANIFSRSSTKRTDAWRYCWYVLLNWTTI